MARRAVPVNDASCGRSGACVEPLYGIAEREPLDLLDERNRITAGLATEAHKTSGTGVNDQIRPAAVRMEWTPADERRAGSSKLDAVALDDLCNRMLLTDARGIDAFSCG